MFVMTAKLNRKKLAAVFIVIILVAAAAIAIPKAVRKGGESINSSAEAAAYLEALGWQLETEPLETREIIIPRQFTDVYAHYIELQRRQGFALEDYGGASATRYTFRILNYPGGEDGIVADLVVCSGKVIAGDVQSTAIDGFMEGLRDSAPGGK